MNEVYLSRMVSHRQLDAWLTVFFGIEPGIMGIHASDDEFIDSAGAYAVNVAAHDIGGDFPQQSTGLVQRKNDSGLDRRTSAQTMRFAGFSSHSKDLFLHRLGVEHSVIGGRETLEVTGLGPQRHGRRHLDRGWAQY